MRNHGLARLAEQDPTRSSRRRPTSSSKPKATNAAKSGRATARSRAEASQDSGGQGSAFRAPSPQRRALYGTFPPLPAERAGLTAGDGRDGGARRFPILPNEDSAMRLIGVVPMDTDELWPTTHRSFDIAEYWQRLTSNQEENLAAQTNEAA